MDPIIKNRAYDFIRQIVLSVVIFMSGNTSSFAAADRIAIAQTPLFLGAGVQPNVFFVSDDSGSMDWETMMPSHWRYDAYDSDRLRSGEFRDYGATIVEDGVWRAAEFAGTDSMDAAYEYLYDNADNVYPNGCNGGRGRAEICGDATNSPFDVDWRARSSGLNKVFYNANIEYKPWSGPCGNGDCADAVFTDARSDPYSTQPGNAISRNLATNGNGQSGAFIYDVWIDDSGYDLGEAHPDSGPRFNETGYAASELKTGAAGLAADLANGEVDLWDSHMRFTVDATQINVKLFTYNPVPIAGATQGLNENTNFLDINLTGAACYNILGNDAMVRSIRNNIIDSSTSASTLAAAAGAPGCRTIVETRQNIANWYQYYRRRAFPVKNAVAAVIDAQPNFRYGMTLLNENTSNTGGIFIEVPLQSVNNVTTHNLKIKEDYFAYRQGSNGTPLRNALQMAGEYYSNNLTNREDPIKYSCQKNFTILFTDGFWNGADPANIGNNDGDSTPRTVADVAYKYYIDDINNNPLFNTGPTNGNDVERDDTESDLPNTGTDNNPTTFQHMVTFAVAFGVTGKLVDSDTDEDDYPDVDYAGNSWGGDPAKNGNWGTAASGPDKIDDLWHAAYNTGGTFASASTPDEITQRLINAISNIAKRQSSASAVALNSGTLNANSRLYQAAFNSSNWSGSLRSIPIQDGPVDENPE
ncbi:Type IV fimbrial biogenesis protein PilY1, partial [hydrothermal vent metagenome]